MNTHILQVKNLQVEYRTSTGSVLAIDDLSFELSAGEFLTIVGPSGSGKTTLLRTILGLVAPRRGLVIYEGETVEAVPAKVGVVFQEYNRSLFPWLSVEKNVTFGLHGLPSNEARSRAADALRLLGLSDFAAKYPWQLSGGMQQRAAIARAISPRPTLLLMDEPFASVDAQTRLYLEDLILDLWERLTFSALFVTHDIDEAIFLADRVLVLSGRPARAIAQLKVGLPRPRDQVETKGLREFHTLRAKIFDMIAIPDRDISLKQDL